MVYIQEHWLELVVIINTVILLAGRIAKLTPTKKDDLIVAKMKNILLTIGLEPKEKA